MTGHILFWVVALGGLTFTFSRIRSGHVREVVVSLFAIFAYSFCLWLPAYLQVQLILESKLERASFLGPPDSQEFEELAVFWALELFVLISAEFLFNVASRKSPRKQSESHGRTAQTKSESWSNANAIALALIFIGLFSTFAFPTPGLEDRGAGGQGIPIMLRTCLVTGLALLVYFRCFGNKWYILVVFAGTIFLVAANVRSPLVVIFLAFMASQLYRWRVGVSARKLFVMFLLIGGVSLIASFMSSMRANLARSLGLSFQDVLNDTFSNPLVGVYESGVDTLDGYRFSQEIAQYEPAKPSDLALSVLTFIPRLVWPDKPSSISVEMSTKYLDYRSSGQFLSPMGYLNLVSGSYLIGLSLLFVFGILVSILCRRFYSSFWLTIVLVVCFRFLVGGSSFDIYYGLVLAAPIVVVKSFMNWYVRPKPQITSASGPPDLVSQRAIRLRRRILQDRS